MLKRVTLFLLTNLAVLLVLGIVLRVLGLDRMRQELKRQADELASRQNTLERMRADVARSQQEALEIRLAYGAAGRSSRGSGHQVPRVPPGPRPTSSPPPSSCRSSGRTS